MIPPAVMLRNAVSLRYFGIAGCIFLKRCSNICWENSPAAKMQCRSCHWMGSLSDFSRTPYEVWINNIVIHKEVGKFTGRDFQAGLCGSLLPKSEVGKLHLSKFLLLHSSLNQFFFYYPSIIPWSGTVWKVNHYGTTSTDLTKLSRVRKDIM